MIELTNPVMSFAIGDITVTITDNSIEMLFPDRTCKYVTWDTLIRYTYHNGIGYEGRNETGKPMYVPEEVLKKLRKMVNKE